MEIHFIFLAVEMWESRCWALRIKGSKFLQASPWCRSGRSNLRRATGWRGGQEAKHSTSESHGETRCTETIRDLGVDSLALAIISMPHVCFANVVLCICVFNHALSLPHWSPSGCADCYLATVIGVWGSGCRRWQCQTRDTDLIRRDSLIRLIRLIQLNRAVCMQHCARKQRQLDSLCRLDMSKSLVRHRIPVGSCSGL